MTEPPARNAPPQAFRMTMETIAARPDAADRAAGASQKKPRRWLWWSLVAVGLLLVIGVAAGGYWLHGRYAVADTMTVPVTEYTTAEYPEDPAGRSVRYDRYNGRTLQLVKRDATHFDFIFTPTDPHIATVTFKNIDVSLMTVRQPDWVKADAGLTKISLIDREWNRQQVRFPLPSPHVEITGGDGFETANITEAALAKNCLNAGLWEVLLYDEEQGSKAMYYQGWFTFPLGQYWEQFEQNTGLKYTDWWYPLEHWQDPAGTPINLDQLRTVQSETLATATLDRDEPIMFAGEQIRKARTTNLVNLRTWGDIADRPDVTYAAFIPPGRYSVKDPWENQYWRLNTLDKVVLRQVTTPAAPDRTLQELELIYKATNGDAQRLFIGGVDLAALPQLPVTQYNKGLYMPMGIGVPPFYQTYADLTAAPPWKSPYYSVLLDGAGRWIDHHTTAIDGPVLHRDADDPNLVHLYLLSYERHMLVAHITIRLDALETL